MADESFEIQKEQVFAREESGAKLFGWEKSELLLMGGTVMVFQFLFHNGKVTFGALFLSYVYIKKIKSMLPERFITNAIRFYTRKHLLYRAAGRDIQWRPPITPDR